MKLHIEVLTAAQQRLLPACAGPAKEWQAYLAGGSALALHLGHRKSDDFDWFTAQTTPPNKLLADLRSLGGTVDVLQNTEGTFNGSVDGVKFSLFRYRYALLETPVAAAGCKLAALPDLAAMKLAAVSQRSMKRDYVDVHALMTIGKMTLERQLGFFQQKFPKADSSIVVRALGYFTDVDKGPMPEMVAFTKWDVVKRDISRSLRRLDLSRP